MDELRQSSSIIAGKIQAANAVVIGHQLVEAVTSSDATTVTVRKSETKGEQIRRESTQHTRDLALQQLSWSRPHEFGYTSERE